MTLPFELPKNHKCNIKRDWKYKGLITDKFDEIYDRYIHSSQCELCDKIYEKTYERCLDHCHNTGKFRNVVCRTCNLNLRKQTSTSITGEQYICIKKNKTYKTGYCYKIQITRFGKKICEKHRSTLEDAIKCRDNFIKENPSLFT